MDEQQRKWFCRVTKINNTQNGLYEYDFDSLYDKLTSKYDNVLLALHDKDINNVHCHIIIQNSSAIRFSTIKNLIPYGDIEKQRGSNLQCYEYCLHIDEKSKETEKDQYDDSCIKTNIENLGVWKILDNKLGSRNDLASIVEMIKNGTDNMEILDKYPSQYLLHSKAITAIRQDILRETKGKTFRKLEVTYIYGSTGVGKTRYVMEKHGYDNVYQVTSYGTGQFDGYMGEDVIVFDEFRSSIPIAQMLTFLDGYPLWLPCRYNNKTALYTKVYIISNIPLSAQYPNVQLDEPKTYDAFLRRINEVYNFDNSKYVPEIKNNKKILLIEDDKDWPF